MNKIPDYELEKHEFLINFVVVTRGETYEECYQKAIISAKEFIDNYFKHNYLRQF